MLPYLKPKKAAGIAEVSYSSGESKQEPTEHSMGRMSAAEDLLRAIASKDASAVADALQAHHIMMDEEGMGEV